MVLVSSCIQCCNVAQQIWPQFKNIIATNMQNSVSNWCWRFVATNDQNRLVIGLFSEKAGLSCATFLNTATTTIEHDDDDDDDHVTMDGADDDDHVTMDGDDDDDDEMTAE